jgi:hypothetical protein
MEFETEVGTAIGSNSEVVKVVFWDPELEVKNTLQKARSWEECFGVGIGR